MADEPNHEPLLESDSGAVEHVDSATDPVLNQVREEDAEVREAVDSVPEPQSTDQLVIPEHLPLPGMERPVSRKRSDNIIVNFLCDGWRRRRG